MISKKIDAFWKYLRGLSGSKKTSLIILVLSTFSLLIFAFVIITARIVPFYLIVIIMTVLLVVFEVLYFLMFYWKVHRIVRVLSNVTCIVIAVILMIASFYVNAIANLFEKIQVGDTEKIEYSVLVRKNDSSKLKGVGYIANQTIGFYEDNNVNKVEEDLKQKIIEAAGGDFGMKFVEEASLYNLGEQFLEGENKMKVVCLSQAQIQILSDKLEDFNENVKSIYFFQLDSPAYRANEADEISGDAPFVLFLSVADRFNLLTDIEHEKKSHDDYDNNLRKFKQESLGDTHGYSEINQLLITNPKTNKILILNIPANYFISSDDNDEAGDTLADTGLIGIEESIDDLEQLFGIKINYYLKTTFDGLEPLMRELGETNYDVNSEGQKQEVLNTISNKLSDSGVLWQNYSPILMAMGNAFQTDMPVSLMTNLLNKQITSRAKWDIEEYDVDGTEEQQALAILGNDDVKSQVVMPQDESVGEAKEEIQSVLNGR